MKSDLIKLEYNSKEEYNSYIYGSADVVGLMCLKVFVNGDQESYKKLKKAGDEIGISFSKGLIF